MRLGRLIGIGAALATWTAGTGALAAAPKKPSPAAGEDPFEQMVKRAESGARDLDFAAMRKAFLASPAFARSLEAAPKVAELEKEMFEQMKPGGDPKIVQAKAREVLALDYMDLEAHKARRQSCDLLGDKACGSQGMYIANGLLKALIATGDGKSCERGWKVVSVAEEYFIVRMLEQKPVGQKVVEAEGKTCDEMQVLNVDGNPRRWFFDVGDLLQAKARLAKKAGKP